MRAPRPVIAVALCLGLLSTAACGDSEPAPTAASSSPSVSTPTSSTSAPVSSSTPAPAPRCGARELADMTLRERLAQLIVVGVTDAADARRIVADEHIGGVFVGSWSDLSMLSDGSLEKLSAEQDHPLMVTVDQEGGRVSRLASLGIDLPSAREMAQTMTPDEVRGLARTAGEKMADLGITVDFAPVADVSAQSDDEVIGDRSFSDDPVVVAEYAGAFAAGLQDAGIMPVFKHFPGHGHGSGDSHTGTVATPPLDELIDVDLAPYRTLLRDPGDAGVMVGHLIVPGLTGPETPASISPKAITMLRTGEPYGGPGFNGVVFSDDLSGMAAISERYPIDEAVIRAIRAGADIGLWLTTDKVSAVLDALEKAVADERLTPARVDRSVVRILRAKGELTC